MAKDVWRSHAGLGRVQGKTAGHQTFHQRCGEGAASFARSGTTHFSGGFTQGVGRIPLGRLPAMHCKVHRVWCAMFHFSHIFIAWQTWISLAENESWKKRATTSSTKKFPLFYEKRKTDTGVAHRAIYYHESYGQNGPQMHSDMGKHATWFRTALAGVLLGAPKEKIRMYRDVDRIYKDGETQGFIVLPSSQVYFWTSNTRRCDFQPF